MLVTKDFKLKYRSSILGVVWSLINPLSLMLVYILAFQYIIGSPIENFTLYLISGLFPWTFFASGMQQSTESVIQSGALIKNVNFPKEIIPLTDILFNFVEFLITMVVYLFIAFGILNAKMSVAILSFPLLLVFQFMFMFGIGMSLSAVAVYFRDLQHIVEVLIQPIFWLTPIIYDVGMVPDLFRPYLNLNPFAAFITAYHDVFYRAVVPSKVDFLSIVVWTIFSLVIGFTLFNRYKSHFAETV
jgi:ABC-type polysaccharide/polyol phosphate export permease